MELEDLKDYIENHTQYRLTIEEHPSTSLMRRILLGTTYGGENFTQHIPLAAIRNLEDAMPFIESVIQRLDRQVKHKIMHDMNRRSNYSIDLGDSYNIISERSVPQNSIMVHPSFIRNNATSIMCSARASDSFFEEDSVPGSFNTPITYSETSLWGHGTTVINPGFHNYEESASSELMNSMKEEDACNAEEDKWRRALEDVE